MPVKLPESVSIGPHQYKVLYPHAFTEQRDIWGNCDHELHVIRVAAVDGYGQPRPDSAILRTFFHELVHAIACVYGYAKILEEERDVDAMAQGLTQVFLAGQMPVVEMSGADRELVGKMINGGYIQVDDIS